MEYTLHSNRILYDKAATVRFYKSQDPIVEDCNCEGCWLYVENVVHLDFEIFRVLKDLGVDLLKNLRSEPDGVFVTLGDKGEMVHCTQTYQIVGRLAIGPKFEVYTNVEHGYRIEAEFTDTYQEVAIKVYLTIAEVRP